jgi:hypothetical protein
VESWGEDLGSKDIFRLSLSVRHFAELEARLITFTSVLNRECRTLSVSNMSVADVLNAIGRLISKELGTGDEHRAKIIESVLALQKAREDPDADPITINDLENAHNLLQKGTSPPIVRLIAID